MSCHCHDGHEDHGAHHHERHCRHGHHGHGCERHSEHRCCCRGSGHGDGCGCGRSCRCHGRCGERERHGEGKGSHLGFQRRFRSKADEVAELEAYLSELKAEAQAVEERLSELRR